MRRKEVRENGFGVDRRTKGCGSQDIETRRHLVGYYAHV